MCNLLYNKISLHTNYRLVNNRSIITGYNLLPDNQGEIHVITYSPHIHFGNLSPSVLYIHTPGDQSGLNYADLYIFNCQYNIILSQVHIYKVDDEIQ